MSSGLIERVVLTALCWDWVCEVLQFGKAVILAVLYFFI